MDIIDATGRAPFIDEAARIWAEATAARDGHAHVPTLCVSHPVIQDVLDRSSRAFLLIARSADGTAAGFAAIEPAPDNEAAAQVSYIGVHPRLWGQRIGETLLLETCRRLKTAGYASVELSVYADNHRAATLYQRLGWHAVGPPTAHPRTSKPLQRYELHLKPARYPTPESRSELRKYLTPNELRDRFLEGGTTCAPPLEGRSGHWPGLGWLDLPFTRSPRAGQQATAVHQ